MLNSGFKKGGKSFSRLLEVRTLLFVRYVEANNYSPVFNSYAASRAHKLAC